MNAFGNYSEGLLHKGLCDRPCSNRLLRLSDKALIPKEIKALRVRLEFFGVADGTRTHDDQNHNLGLYQLSYSHHGSRNYRRPAVCGRAQRSGAEACAAGLISTL